MRFYIMLQSKVGLQTIKKHGNVNFEMIATSFNQIFQRKNARNQRWHDMEAIPWKTWSDENYREFMQISQIKGMQFLRITKKFAKELFFFKFSTSVFYTERKNIQWLVSFFFCLQTHSANQNSFALLMICNLTFAFLEFQTVHLFF